MARVVRPLQSDDATGMVGPISYARSSRGTPYIRCRTNDPIRKSVSQRNRAAAFTLARKITSHIQRNTGGIAGPYRGERRSLEEHYKRRLSSWYLERITDDRFFRVEPQRDSRGRLRETKVTPIRNVVPRRPTSFHTYLTSQLLFKGRWGFRALPERWTAATDSLRAEWDPTPESLFYGWPNTRLDLLNMTITPGFIQYWVISMWRRNYFLGLGISVSGRAAQIITYPYERGSLEDEGVRRERELFQLSRRIFGKVIDED